MYTILKSQRVLRVFITFNFYAAALWRAGTKKKKNNAIARQRNLIRISHDINQSMTASCWRLWRRRRSDELMCLFLAACH